MASLAFNSLVKLPTGMQGLTFLNLTGNSLDTLDFASLPHTLEYLMAEHMDMEFIEPVSRFESLKYLVLD